MVNRIVNYPPIPIQPIESANLQGINSNVDRQRQSAFADLLREKIQPKELSFSAHANNRLTQRNINLSSEDIQRLENAVDKVAEKGSKDSLIMMDNVAYIINVPNRTVITAMDNDSMKENVFTNIDSAMIV